MILAPLKHVIGKETWSEPKSWRENQKVGVQGVPKCYKEHSANTDHELHRLAHWTFNNGIKVERMNKELRNEIIVKLAVTVSLTIDLVISKATQPQPTLDSAGEHNSNKEFAGYKRSGNANEKEVLESPFSTELQFHLLDLVLSGQQKLMCALEHLMRKSNYRKPTISIQVACSMPSLRSRRPRSLRSAFKAQDLIDSPALWSPCTLQGSKKT